MQALYRLQYTVSVSHAGHYDHDQVNGFVFSSGWRGDSPGIVVTFPAGMDLKEIETETGLITECRCGP
jgi:hypothetical protein